MFKLLYLIEVLGHRELNYKAQFGKTPKLLYQFTKNSPARNFGP